MEAAVSRRLLAASGPEISGWCQGPNWNGLGGGGGGSGVSSFLGSTGKDFRVWAAPGALSFGILSFGNSPNATKT